MRIAIDGNEANVVNKVGVHQYAYEILWGLYRQNNGQKNKDSFTVFLKGHPNPDLPKENVNWKYTILKGGKVWILTKLMPYLLVNSEYDVLFVPSHYTPIVTRIPVVATIHDLGYLDSSEQFNKYDFWQLKYWTAKTVRASTKLIAVSDSTKKDIVRHYKLDSEKIAIVHHGYDTAKYNTDISDAIVRRTKSKYHINGNYLLFLSTLKPSKNIEGLLAAFADCKNRLSEKYTLVIAGSKGWLYESIFAKVVSLGLEKDVVFTGFVHEDDKPALYYGSRLFALPVFWEGFGMTALESIACGTPVVSSSKGGLPEVLGDAGNYVDPYSVKDISQKIESVLDLKKSDYKKIVQKGIRRAKTFSWEKASRETLQVLRSVV